MLIIILVEFRTIFEERTRKQKAPTIVEALVLSTITA